jgi:hypothetical protein
MGLVGSFFNTSYNFMGLVGSQKNGILFYGPLHQGNGTIQISMGWTQVPQFDMNVNMKSNVIFKIK